MPSNDTQQELLDIAFQKDHVVEMMFYPNAWLSARDWLTAQNKSCLWNVENFPPTTRSAIPHSPGVYVFVVTPNIFNLEHACGLFYIGKATNLYSRISPYIAEIGKRFKESKRPHIWKMVNLWDGHLKYHYMATRDVAEAEELEAEMIKAFRPYFNKQYDAETSQFMRAF